MEWLTSIRTAIDYMEDHLEDDISAQDVADHVHLSPFFIQKGFSLMTGYGIGEYIRNRRLYVLHNRERTNMYCAHKNGQNNDRVHTSKLYDNACAQIQKRV